MINKKECNERISFGNSLYLSIKKDAQDEAHGYVIDLLSDMGFDSSYLTEKIDISFESINDLYIPLFTEFGIVDIFIGTELVHLVFHFKNEKFKRENIPIIRKHFNY